MFRLLSILIVLLCVALCVSVAIAQCPGGKCSAFPSFSYDTATVHVGPAKKPSIVAPPAVKPVTTEAVRKVPSRPVMKAVVKAPRAAAAVLGKAVKAVAHPMKAARLPVKAVRGAGRLLFRHR